MKMCKKSWSKDREKKIKQRKLIIYWRTSKDIKYNDELKFKFNWKKKMKLKNDFTTFKIDCKMMCYDLHNCCYDFQKNKFWLIFKTMINMRYKIDNIFILMSAREMI